MIINRTKEKFHSTDFLYGSIKLHVTNSLPSQKAPVLLQPLTSGPEYKKGYGD